jgi:hypothetical protein
MAGFLSGRPERGGFVSLRLNFGSAGKLSLIPTHPSPC